MTLMTLPDFLARQLATYAMGLRCSLTVTRSVPSILNESSLQRVPRRRRVSSLTDYLGAASFFADLHHGGVCLRSKVWTGACWHCDKTN
jgi:hypothetical protein